MLNVWAKWAVIMVVTALMAVEFLSIASEAESSQTAIDGCTITIQTDPSRPAELSRGDSLNGCKFDVTARIRYYISAAFGESIDVAVVRHGKPVRGTLAFDQHIPINPSAIFWKLEFWAIGVLVLLKGRSRAAVALAAMSLGFGLGGNESWYSFAPVALRAPLEYIVTLAFIGAFAALFLLFKDTFGHSGSDKLATRTEAACWSTLAAYLVVTLVNFSTALLLGRQYAALLQAEAVLNVLIFVLWLAYSAVLFLRGRGELRRPGVAWVFWTTIIGLSGPFIDSGVSAAGGSSKVTAFLSDATPLIMPPAYAYSILRYHAIDVAIALNRAVVATVITLAFIGIIAVLESEIERFAIDATKMQIDTLKMAVPFALGIAFTPLHRLIETASERLLFKRKLAAEHTLATLRSDVARDDDPRDVISRTLRRLQEIFRFTAIAAYVRAGNDLRRIASAGSPGALPDTIEADGPLGSTRLDIYLRGRPTGSLFWICGQNGLATAQEERVLHEIAHEIGIEMSFERSA